MQLFFFVFWLSFPILCKLLKVKGYKTLIWSLYLVYFVKVLIRLVPSYRDIPMVTKEYICLSMLLRCHSCVFITKVVRHNDILVCNVESTSSF